MNKPVIGITADLARRKDGVHIGETQQYLNDCYLNAVLLSGGAPLILPVTADESVIDAYLNIIDGLLLSGGGDINPLLFGEEPHPHLGVVDSGRDAMEIILARRAVAAKTPLLAICRGAQILNVALGGTMYQHLSPDEFGVQHQQKSAGDFASHTIFIESGSRLASLCGVETVVNSFHHQAVKDVAAGFIATARAKDGVIEAIELADADAFAVGVQWHPERLVEKHPAMLQLFGELTRNSRWPSAAGRQKRTPQKAATEGAESFHA